MRNLLFIMAMALYSVSSSAAMMVISGDTSPAIQTHATINCTGGSGFYIGTSCRGQVGPLAIANDIPVTSSFGMYTVFLSDSIETYKVTKYFNEYVQQSGTASYFLSVLAGQQFGVRVSGNCGGPCDLRANISWTIEPSAVPQVPIPAAAFMFAPALLGFMGLRRRAKNSAA